jgi:cytochrome c553
MSAHFQRSLASFAAAGTLGVLLSATPVSAATHSTFSTNACLDCHRNEKESRLVQPTLHFAEDIHAQRGLGCVSCHGGDATDSDITGMDPDKGYIGKPKRSEIAEICARCHANAEFMKRYNPKPYIFSLAEFRTSVHCKKIAEGDTKVATCTNCHGVHGIRPHKDPASPVYHKNVPGTCASCHNPQYMAGRTVPTNQFELYKTSVHGKALLEKGDMSAPACNDCHGNHGAVPPNTRDISRVCANCHGREGELFAGTKVAETLQLEGKRGCVTCHGNHGVQQPTDDMIGLGTGGVCGQCHEPRSAGEFAAAKIVPQFHGLKLRIAEADSLLLRAERLGMPTSTGRELLKQAGDQLLNTRVVIHSFDSKLILTAISEGTDHADKAVVAGNRALKDWRDRRVGMGMSLVAIVFMIGLLMFRIRQAGSAVESKGHGTAPHGEERP